MTADISPKRALGQHFLVDPNILRVIGRLAKLDESDVVLEIGPGLGVLTTFLADRVRHVHAVEVDKALEPTLRAAIGDRSNVSLVFGDAMKPRPVELRPEGDEARLQPAVQRRRHDRRRQPRGDAVHPPVVRDGAEGGRRALLRRARDKGLRGGLRARPARRRPHGHSRCVANGVPATSPGRLDARRVHACCRRPPDYDRIKDVVQAAFAHRRKTLPNSLALSGLAARGPGAGRARRARSRGPATRAEDSRTGRVRRGSRSCLSDELPHRRRSTSRSSSGLAETTASTSSSPCTSESRSRTRCRSSLPTARGRGLSGGHSRHAAR